MTIFKTKKQNKSREYTITRNGYHGLQTEKRAARVVRHTGLF